jgi:hypothetical protein
MLALVIVLVVTNVVTVAALVVALRIRLGHEAPPEPAFADAVTPGRGGAGVAGVPGARGRRVISVEIHNPIELAGHRNRVFGIAGSFVPDLTRRVVYDQTARLLREGLAEHRVVADVRVHVFAAPAQPAAVAEPPAHPLTPPAVAEITPRAFDYPEDEAADRLAD